MANLPYVQVAGTLESMLEKIKTASVPEKFSQDFVNTKLAMKGGTARSTIPFIKKMGLVASDGTPTDRYREFRNPQKSGIAIRDAMMEVYETLFEMNESVYELDNKKLKGLIVEATGAKADATAVQKTLSTFNVLKKLADFESEDSDEDAVSNQSVPEDDKPNQLMHVDSAAAHRRVGGESINLSYTINLNLPVTTDVDVFNAIFRSLKEHLLQR